MLILPCWILIVLGDLPPIEYLKNNKNIKELKEVI